MRLLSFDDEGGLRLTELYGEIPPYVILSHTWGNDADEVTYRDVMEHTGTTKVGYQKIQFCGKQALKDGYVPCHTSKWRVTSIVPTVSKQLIKPWLLDTCTSGWTRAASKSLIVPSYRRQLTPCFAGIKDLVGAMCICEIFRQMMKIGRMLSGEADGSLGAGHFKSSSLRLQ